MNRRWPPGAVYLLVIIVALPVVVGLLVASRGGEEREAVVGRWVGVVPAGAPAADASTDTDGVRVDRSRSVAVSEHDGIYTMRFENAADGTSLSIPATLSVGQLDGIVPDGVSPGAGGLPLAAVPGATVTLQTVDKRTLGGSVTPPGAGMWADAGEYRRYGYFTDPLVRAAFVIVGVVVGIGLLLAMIIPMVTRAGDDSRPGRRETAVRGLVIVATIVGVAVLMLGDPLFGWIALVVVLPVWFFFLLRWWRREWPETREAIGRFFSSTKRREFRVSETEREAQAERGDDLQRVLTVLTDDRDSAE